MHTSVLFGLSDSSAKILHSWYLGSKKFARIMAHDQHKTPQLVVPEMVPETQLSSMDGRIVTWREAVSRMIATRLPPSCKVGKVHISYPVATPGF